MILHLLYLDAARSAEQDCRPAFGNPLGRSLAVEAFHTAFHVSEEASGGQTIYDLQQGQKMALIDLREPASADNRDEAAMRIEVVSCVWEGNRRF